MDMTMVVLGEPQEYRCVWGETEQEALSEQAREFKSAGDMAGVHLCAVVEAEMQKCLDDSGRCQATGMFYLALVVSRGADGADHELAHLLVAASCRANGQR